MPFLRHARDKRGYETTFVMHSYRPASGQAVGKTRLLYMFRTPSNRKVGRNLLDPEVMEALEHTHPDLTFDWQGMLRAPAQVAGEPERERERGGRQRHDRSERGERGERSARPEKERRSAEPEVRREPASELPLAILEDESLVGRTAGAVEAARMRAAYNDLLQRIARRARTPEERDRLTERAGRLNPDEWMDAAAVSAAVATFDADCESIRQELPRRRRGRRGGRARDRETAGSAIIEHGENERELVGQAGPDDGGLDGGLGAGDTGAADSGLARDDAEVHDLD